MATHITNFQKWLDSMDAANHGKDKVSWVNTLKLTPHVEHDGERVLIPESQIYNVPEGFSLITVDADNTVPANFDTEGQMVQFTLDRSHVNYVKNVKAKWQLTAATADVIMAPPQFWLKRAEFWGNGPNGDKIQTLYVIIW